MFIDHGPDPQHAHSTKKDADAEKERIMERSRQARSSTIAKDRENLVKAQELEDANRLGATKTQEFGYKLIAACEPPRATIKGNYVFGLPSISWKSELRDRLSVQVFNKSTNSRYQQPAGLPILANYDRVPLGGTWGNVHPD